MAQEEVRILRLRLQELSRRARLLRAFSYAIRSLAFGLPLLILLKKSQLPLPSPLLSFLVIPAVVGALYGAFTSLNPLDVARLADRRLRLQERLSTAFECLATGRRGEVVEALLRDAAAQRISLQKALPFPWGEGKVILPSLALSALLFTLPPFPLQGGGGPKGLGSQEPREERGEELKASSRGKSSPERRGEQRAFPGGVPFRREGWEELHALFQDTKLSQKRPDFGSFMKGADDRLKLLALQEAIPDLGRDDTLSPYQLILRRAKEKLRDLKFEGLSGEELQRILEGMRRLGEGGKGLETLPFSERALSRPSSEKALETLERALQQLWEKAGGPSGKGLKQIPYQGGEGLERGPSGDAVEEGKFGGTLPGRGRSPQVRGDPTPRIEGSKRDTALSGEVQEGKKEAYATNLPGPAAKNPSRLPSLDLLSRYRRMMEESLSREPIPFDYREQVKHYFTSLEP